MNVLAVGDVVGRPGLDRISRSLRWWKKQLNADFVVVNGENASVVGMTPDQGEEIFDAGADVITMGNHTFKKREIVPYLEDNSRVLRPANLAPQLPGSGVGVYETKFGPVAVIDLIGRCNMDYHAENPFLMVDKLRTQLDTKLILVELHAEATSEKLAMGYMLDGQVSAVWGTHTHRLCDRPGHDRPSGIRAGHSAPTVHRQFPGGPAGPVSLGRGANENGRRSLYHRHEQRPLHRCAPGGPAGTIERSQSWNMLFLPCWC